MRRAALAILLGLLLFSAPLAQSGIILLQDFATNPGTNGDTPPGPLWSAYNGSTGGSGQTYDYLDHQFNIHGTGHLYWHFQPYPYNAPNNGGYAKGHLEAGTWDAGVTRLTFQAICERSTNRRGDGGAIVEFGTYILKTPSGPTDQGAHYYHQLDPNIPAGRWMTYVLNNHPQHQVGSSGNPGINPGGVPYYDKLTRFYWDLLVNQPATTCSFDQFVFSKVTGEPDTQVSSITAVYTGSRYEVAWATMPNVTLGYTVKYCATSLHAGCPGTVLGTTTSTGNDYTGAIVTGPTMPEQPGGMYFAIQPAGLATFSEVFLPNGLVPPPVQQPTTTVVTCPQSVQATGQALTPCSAQTRTVDAFVASPAVLYANNMQPGTASASASYPGTASFGPSQGSATFQITPIPPPSSLTCDVAIVKSVSGKVVTVCQ